MMIQGIPKSSRTHIATQATGGAHSKHITSTTLRLSSNTLMQASWKRTTPTTNTLSTSNPPNFPDIPTKKKNPSEYGPTVTDTKTKPGHNAIHGSKTSLITNKVGQALSKSGKIMISVGVVGAATLAGIISICCCKRRKTHDVENNEAGLLNPKSGSEDTFVTVENPNETVIVTPTVEKSLLT